MRKKGDIPGQRFTGTTFADLKKAIDECRACPLWERATQGVPGEGSSKARVMLVGEQRGQLIEGSMAPYVLATCIPHRFCASPMRRNARSRSHNPAPISP